MPTGVDALAGPGEGDLPCTYQLLIKVDQPVWVTVGRFGRFEFPAGRYVYTGSARRHIEARIARHLAHEKKLRWHIDYLLAAPGVRVLSVRRLVMHECEANSSVGGEVSVPGFGSSDCRAGCASHLMWLGDGHHGFED